VEKNVAFLHGNLCSDTSGVKVISYSINLIIVIVNEVACLLPVSGHSVIATAFSICSIGVKELIPFCMWWSRHIPGLSMNVWERFLPSV